MNAERDLPVFFAEEQQFRQRWLWGLLLGAALIAPAIIVGFYGSDAWPHKTEAGQFAAWVAVGFGLFISVPIHLGLCALFYFMKLLTEVRADGIYVRFIPFHRSCERIPFSRIKSHGVRRYRPIAEYGGWGVRLSWGKAGKAYNAYGDEGVQLVLSDDSKLLIGSQRASEFSSAIDKAMKRNVGA